MSVMSIKLLFTQLALLMVATMSAQVNFNTSVNKDKIAIDERLKVSFEMDKDGDNFEAPTFEGFRVTSGPSQSVSRSWINGKKSFSKSFTYYLSPKKVGKFQIGQARMVYEGKTYKTSPVSIEVTSTTNKQQQVEGTTNHSPSKEMYITAVVSNKEPYINEAVFLEYRLYWDYNSIEIRAPQGVDIPKYNNFWSENIEMKEYDAKKGSYKGKDMAYITIKKVVLFPQKTGKIPITPITVGVPVMVPTNRRGFFGQLVMDHSAERVSGGGTNLNVKPLPDNAPSSFKGAVGNFSFKGRQNKRNLNANESLELSLEVSGTGNLHLFKLPELILPNTIDAYDPEHKEQFKVTSKGMKGKITDTYTLVPQYKGKYPFADVTFSYFDPKAKTYKEVSIDHLGIDVLQGPVKNISTSDESKITENTTDTITPVLDQQHFNFIATEANLEKVKTDFFFRSNLFWVLLLSPFLLLPVVIFVSRKSKKFSNDLEGKKTRQTNKLVKKYLSTAKKNLGNSEQFYVSLEKALHNYLKVKLKIETSQVNKENITELLTDKNISSEVTQQFGKLLESCELSRYTPTNLETMNEDYKQASLVINAIDKQF